MDRLRVTLSGCEHVNITLILLVTRILLDRPPHSLDVIPGISLITFCVNNSEVEAVLVAVLDVCDSSRDLSSDECLATTRALVVE
jgi:hypothetical protein